MQSTDGVRHMGLLNNVRTGHKLAALSAVGLLSAGVIGAVALVNVREIRQQNTEAAAMISANADFILLDGMIARVDVALRDELLATDDAARRAAVDDLAAVTAAARGIWTQVD